MVRQAVFWSFTAQITGFVIQFGSSVIIARLLSPKEIGVYAVAMAIMGIVQLFASFSVGTYIIREQELTEDTLASAYTVNAVISIGLAAAIFVSSFGSGYFFDEPSVPKVLRLLSLTPVIGILQFRPSVMLQRAMQLRGMAVVGFFNGLLVASVTIGAALAGASSMSPAYGSVVGALFGTVGTLIVGGKHHSFRLSLKDWKPITAFGLRLMSIGGISSAAVRVSDIILGHFLGLAALGLYSRANNLTNLLFTNVYGSATRVVFAQLSEAQRDGDRVTEVYLRGFRLIVGLMGPLLLGLAVLSRPAIRVLYGDRWLGAAIPLSLLLLGQFVSLSFAMNWELFVVRDELKVQTRLELIRSIIGVSTTAVASMFSLVAVATTGIVDNVLSLLIYNRHMPRLARTTASTFHRLYGEVVVLSVGAALPSAVLMFASGWKATTPLTLVFGSIAVGVSLWLGLLYRGSHPLWSELMLLAGKLRRRRNAIA